MKLGTLKDGSRDGRLVVVSRDLKHAIPADNIAPTMQAALDDWDYCSPQLTSLYEDINRNPSGTRVFEPDFALFAAPLPRAYQWLDGSAYLAHVELVRKARGATMPPEFKKDPLMYQGDSDYFIGPRDPIEALSEGVPMGTSSSTTATSASRSMPQSSDKASIGSRGPMK